MSQGKPNSANPNTMGGRIQRVRVEMGLTQKQLGRESGVHSSAIGRIESSHTFGRIESLIAIAKALDISLYYLFGERTEYGTFGQ